MAYKKFNQQLHEQYDKIGRDVVKNFVEASWGFTVKDNPDKYGIDLLLFKGDDLFGYAEVEVRNSWNTVEFPFKDLNVPQRKKKLLDNPKPTYFFSVNKPLTALFYCPAEAILTANLEEQSNRYIASGELFYKVPLSRLMHVKLEETK